MMDIGQALNLWVQCDGDCEKCPLYDADPETFSVCNLFSEAHMILEAKVTMWLHMN
jgi:hypothetical protein